MRPDNANEPRDPRGFKYATNYVCPTAGCGKVSTYTGWPNPRLEARIARGEIGPGATHCSCGAALVEEVKDGRMWRVSFEMLSPTSGRWKHMERLTDSERSAVEQYEGLLELVSEGQVRSPKLHVTSINWTDR